MSSEVIKHLIYKKKRPRLLYKVEKFHKIILTKMTYKCVHCVNLSVNLFDDTVKACALSRQSTISYIILRNQVTCLLKIALVSRDYGSSKGKWTYHTKKSTVFYRKGYDRSEKRHGAREKGHGATRKGHGAAPF